MAKYIKLTLIVIVFLTASLAYACDQQKDASNTRMESSKPTVMLAKGQYYNDSRRFNCYC